MQDIKPINSNRRISFLRLFFGAALFVFCLVTCPSYGQGKQKRQLTAADYHLWSRLFVEQISEGGQWVSYRNLYDSHKDTLFVQHTGTKMKFQLPGGREGIFNGEDAFACLGTNDSLWFQNLKSGVLKQYADVSEFYFSGNGKYLLLLVKDDNEKKLLVLDMKGSIVASESHISYWRIESERNGVAYSIASAGNNSVNLLFLDSNISKQTVISEGINAFVNLCWKGTSLAFVGTGENPIVYCYSTANRQLKKYELGLQSGFTADMKISDYPYGSMIISDDGSKIFFDLKEKQVLTASEKDTVQIWRANDKLLYSFRKNFGDFVNLPKLAVWHIAANNIKQVTDKELPIAKLSGDYKHALLYDPLAYEPQNHQEGAVDLYITDIASGKRKLVLKKYTGDIESVRFSQHGKYFIYAKDGNWWVYDIAKDTHTNITSALGVPFLQQNKQFPEEAGAYKNPDWTCDDSTILLYDQFDVWAISPNGKLHNRLTRGRELGRTYRIANFETQPSYPRNPMEAKKNRYSLKDGFVLEASDRSLGIGGMYSWSQKEKEQILVWDSKRTGQYQKADKAAVYLYVAEMYDVSPRLVVIDKRKTTSYTLVQSNKQQQDYYWGRSELVHYTAMGKELSGALYYPADYQAGKKYPMVVEIYECKSHLVNEYVNPSENNYGGFNSANFTTQGYFVLHPDINYKEGEPGMSATECVLAAVDAVIAKGLVLPNKIGLIGHSFGGYETNFIVTKTDRFAAAAAGDGWSDLISAYLYVGPTFQRPDFYRGEYDQWRIGKSLFEDTDSYLKNSPVLYAANVSTPFLSWTGEADYHVNYLQSFEFHLALRRLQKKAIMLVYPEEGHSIVQPLHQKDLTARMEAWFAFYLKDDPKCSWMEAK